MQVKYNKVNGRVIAVGSSLTEEQGYNIITYPDD